MEPWGEQTNIIHILAAAAAGSEGWVNNVLRNASAIPRQKEAKRVPGKMRN